MIAAAVFAAITLDVFSVRVPVSVCASSVVPVEAPVRICVGVPVCVLTPPPPPPPPGKQEKDG